MRLISVKFNDQQQAAIDLYTGACALIASAGSGKSTVLVNRIENLIVNHNVPEENILAISFTRNTADDLKSKLKKMGYENVNVGTFHSICARLLAKEGQFYSHEKMVQEWQIEKVFGVTEDSKIDVNDIRSFISYQKNYLRSYTDEFVPKDSEYSEIELRTYFKVYEQFKKKNGLHDFDDYLIDCLEMLKNNPRKYTFDFVLVDESQDNNLANNLLTKEICATGNIMAIGDYKQSIYGFRGSSPEQFMNFEHEWDNAKVINLDTNYRSSKRIVHKANEFIKQYYGDYVHYSDSIAHSKDDGSVKINTYLSREQEAYNVANEIEKLINEKEKLKEIAVLYRLNSHSINIEHELVKRGIDYDITSDGSFFKRKEISGILGYLKLVINPHDDGAMFDIFKFRNYPFNFFSGKLIEEIKQYAGLHNLSLYEAVDGYRYDKEWQRKNAEIFTDMIFKLRLQKDKGVNTFDLIGNIIKSFQIQKYIDDKYKSPEDKKERLDSLETLKSFTKSDSPEKFLKYIGTTKKKSKENSVKLMSLHASKGLEFNNVFLIGVEDSKFPHERSPLLDEARLFYVGVTRPRENLFVSQIGEGNRFINEYR